MPAKDKDPVCICQEAEREYEKGNWAKSLQLYQKYVTTLVKNEGPNGTDVPGMLLNVGDCYANLQSYPEAISSTKRAIEIYHAWNGADDGMKLQAYKNLADQYYRAGQLDQAAATVSEGRKLFAQFPSDREILAHSLFWSAYIKDRDGDLVKAEKLYKQALNIRKELGLKDNETARLLGNLGTVYANQKDYRSAEPLYVERLALYKQINQSHAYSIETYVFELGNIYQLSGKKQKALALYDNYFKEANDELAGHPAVTTITADIANQLINSEEYTKAIEYYDRIAPKELNASSIYLNNLAYALFKTEQYAKAEPVCQRVISLLVATKNGNHDEIVSAYQNYAKLLRYLNREEEAKKIDALAI